MGNILMDKIIKTFTFGVSMIVGTALIMGASAQAADGLYLGIDGAYEKYDVKVQLPDTGVIELAPGLDAKGAAAGFFIGYSQANGRFNLAIELGYGYSFVKDGAPSNPIFTFDRYDLAGGHTFNLSLLPGYKITPAITLYGRVGVSTTQNKEEFTTGAVLVTYNEFRSIFEYGAGLEINMTDDISVRAEYLRLEAKPRLLVNDRKLITDREKFKLGFVFHF
jgi:opacity protein-like surface antigen